ncbi:MAG: hypothetical protein M3P04_02130, partial [Actinomycetota bacterium]|nr:hypothetical protein [Actinomycetota bacterium]
ICTGCTSNPAKDFVHTPGVPVVTAAQAFQPKPVVAPVLHPAGPARVITTPRLAGGAAALLLLGVGWRRRRTTPA